MAYWRMLYCRMANLVLTEMEARHIGEGANVLFRFRVLSANALYHRIGGRAKPMNYFFYLDRLIPL